MPRTTRHALLLGIALLPTLSSAGQTPSFRAGIDLIEVTAVVRDRDGRLIRDLTQADFQILEYGNPQQIVAFDHVSIRTAPAPASASASLEGRDVASNEAFGDRRVFVWSSTRCTSPPATRLPSASAPSNSSNDMSARRTWSLSCRPAALLPPRRTSPPTKRG